MNAKIKRKLSKDRENRVIAGGIQRKSPNKKENENLLRCKQWLLQQKTIKNKAQPVEEELPSDESDDEFPGFKLESNEEAKKSQRRQKSDPSSKMLFVCEWQKCHAALDTYTDLVEHVSGHSRAMIVGIQPPFHCKWDLCGFVSDNGKLFTSHLAYHSYHTHIKTLGEQLLLEKNPLPPCENDSRRRNEIPAVQSEYLCMWKDCEYRLATVQEYFNHVRGHCEFEMKMQRTSGRNAQVQCEWIACDKTFNRMTKMKEHLRVHTKERFLACANCGSAFNSYAKFYDHYKRQAIDNNYKCNQCLRFFATEELLVNHQYHHINNYKCTICDMTCSSPSALAKHFRYRHCKEMPYKCVQCDYSCITKWDLNKHVLRRHEIDKNTYECDAFGCDYTCQSVNQMKKHERDVHGLGRNIYCCHCCDKQYTCGHNLSLHLIKKHGFQLPSGHRRFTYCQDLDGFYRVQTTRIESLEVSEQIMAPSATELANAANVQFELSELKNDGKGLALSIVTKNTATGVKSTGSEQIASLVKDEFCDTDNGNDGGDAMLDEDTYFTRSAARANSDSIAIRAIDDFSVMQKYLKNKRSSRKKIVITVEQMDEDGNVVKTETQQATEFEYKYE